MSVEGSPNSFTLEPQGVVARANGLVFVIPVLALVALAFSGWKLACFVLGVSAIVLVGFTFERIKSWFAWRQARLEIPHASFELGSSSLVSYRRDSKRMRDVGDCMVECTLICRETVRYQQGTDTETERVTVFSKAFSAPGHGTAKGLEADVTIDVPVSRGAPSFDLPNNEVEWFIDVEVRGQGLPKDDQRFDIQVVPVLNTVSIDRPQDS